MEVKIEGIKNGIIMMTMIGWLGRCERLSLQ